MVIRETSAARANRILNSPGVGEYLRPDGGYIDITPIVEADSNECFVLSNGNDAVTLYERTVENVYQMHIGFAQSCRGKRAQETTREMMDWVFHRFASVLWSDVPRWNQPVVRFISRMGAHWMPSSDADTLVWEVRSWAI